jgi:hypothetical protein
VTLGTLSPGAAYATCGAQCDGRYLSDTEDCRFQFGDDPANADDLADCIQEARDDYRSCLDDCGNAAISRKWRFSSAGLPRPCGGSDAVSNLQWQNFCQGWGRGFESPRPLQIYQVFSGLSKDGPISLATT